MSSPIQLGQDVLAAQGRILSQKAKRHGISVAFAVVTAIFILFAAISFHGVLLAVFLQLCHLNPLYSALCVMGVDVLFALIFLLLTLCNRSPSIAEERAKMARDEKLQELKRAIELSTIASLALGPVGRFAGGSLLKLARSPFKRRCKR